MCPPSPKASKASSKASSASSTYTPPDPETISLPPPHILAHYLPSPPYDEVQLGGLASMAVNSDQDLVSSLSAARPWPSRPPNTSKPQTTPPGPRVVAAFGYHPWFVHQFTLTKTTKRDHYTTLFNPKPKDLEMFEKLLPLLPEPQLFAPKLDQMRSDINAARNPHHLVMIGEIGLDSTARVHCEPHGLTPFKTAMSHQISIAKLQLELADELGVPVSFHCVSASGGTLDLLKLFPHVKVDVHSLGGMSGNFLTQVAKSCPGVYFSPSLLVTGRNKDAGRAIAAVPRERVLVESDTHDVSRCDRLVWGAVLWIASVRGWRVESVDEEGEGGDWVMEMEEEEEFDSNGKLVVPREDEVWAVRTLERNWARFMGIVE